MLAPHVPELPRLPSYLDNLIHMHPTFEALDAYLKAPEHSSGERVQGDEEVEQGPLRDFTISNIFSSPLESTHFQHKYDLSPFRLANVRGTYLLPESRWPVRLWADEDFITYFGLDADEPAPADVMAAIQESRIRNPDACHCASCRHGEDLEELFMDFAKQWGTALKLYSGRAHQSQPDYEKLYLSPHVSLPEKDQVLRIPNEQETLHLFLLTARHELGHLYKTVVEWHGRARSRFYLDREDHCLTDWHLGLISARTRGYQYFTTAPIASGEWQEQRNDVCRGEGGL